MGDCKDNMKTMPKSNDAKDKDKSSLGLLPRKRKQDPIQTAQNFADMVEAVDKRVGELVVQKRTELQSESGREEYNRKALAILSTIQYHVDEIIEQMATYSELK